MDSRSSGVGVCEEYVGISGRFWGYDINRPKKYWGYNINCGEKFWG
jgi:hypothetical protein